MSMSMSMYNESDSDSLYSQGSSSNTRELSSSSQQTTSSDEEDRFVELTIMGVEGLDLEVHKRGQSALLPTTLQRTTQQRPNNNTVRYVMSRSGALIPRIVEDDSANSAGVTASAVHRIRMSVDHPGVGSTTTNNNIGRRNLSATAPTTPGGTSSTVGPTAAAAAAVHPDSSASSNDSDGDNTVADEAASVFTTRGSQRGRTSRRGGEHVHLFPEHHRRRGRSPSPTSGTTAANSRPSANISFIWMVLSLVSHTGWGIYPVLARYLQTTWKLPSMSLMAAGNLAVAIVTGFLVFKRGRFMYISKGLVRTLPFLILVTLCRVITNLLAPRFTNAIYVQLVTLSVPFLVALFNRVLLREDLPPWSIPAVIVTSIGATMMLFSSIWPIEIKVEGTDSIGIILAAVSACFLALYMLLVKRATGNQNLTVAGEELLFFLTGPVVLVGVAFMLVTGEDLSQWLELDWTGWLAFLGLAFGVLLTSNILQISALRYLGAATVSSTIAMRLVATLLFSSIIMGEMLSSVTQLLGALIVLVAITAYMWLQRNVILKKERAQRALATFAIESDSEGDGLGSNHVVAMPIQLEDFTTNDGMSHHHEEVRYGRARSTSV